MRAARAGHSRPQNAAHHTHRKRASRFDRRTDLHGPDTAAPRPQNAAHHTHRKRASTAAATRRSHTFLHPDCKSYICMLIHAGAPLPQPRLAFCSSSSLLSHTRELGRSAHHSSLHLRSGCSRESWLQGRSVADTATLAQLVELSLPLYSVPLCRTSEARLTHT